MNNIRKIGEAGRDISRRAPLCEFNRILFLIAILLIPFTVSANAQTLSEEQIKAGFLFNFTRFVEWPPKAFRTSGTQIVLCIVDEPSIFSVLTETVDGKDVNGRKISIRQRKWNDDFHACHVLFLGVNDERRAEKLLQGVRASSILTVGEDPGFIEAGGMINFLIQDNKVKMDLNLEAATQEQLRISAKLIAVSHLVQTAPTKKGN